ncbi:MAG: CoA transferase, partial [Hyphomonadaceae bacterium]|nr:CoA transferase [Hyphomonadaceae bacterium]
AFAARPQSYWTAAFAEAEACGAPVVGLADLPDDPHLMARGTVRRTDDGLHAAPAPRLSAHPDLVSAILAPCDDPVESVLRDAGFTGAEIATLVETGVVRSA